MEQFTIEKLYDLSETIAADFMRTATYPWELLPRIKDYIFTQQNKEY